MTQSIERIPDTLGYLILTEDGAVFSSGGDLENDERTAEKIINLVKTTLKLSGCWEDVQPNFKKLSVLWENFFYVITIANHRVYISKRKNNPMEAVSA